MSNVFFPEFDGLGKQIVLKVESGTPQFSTQVQRGLGGTEFRVARWAAPRRSWKVALSVLPDTGDTDAYQTILAFFMARQGQADSFLWVPPEPGYIQGVAPNPSRFPQVARQIGVGDGAQKTFPLVRPIGGAVFPYLNQAEPVQWVDTRSVVPSFTENGVTKTPSVVADGGRMVAQFTTAPAAGAVVLATFDLAYRVRFSKDAVEFKQWAWRLWKGGTVELEQVFE